jgi:hypothetical protein
MAITNQERVGKAMDLAIKMQRSTGASSLSRFR